MGDREAYVAEARNHLGRVVSKLRQVEQRGQDWSFWQHVMWRWLLPYEAGRHEGRLEALRGLEADLLHDIAQPQESFEDAFARLCNTRAPTTPKQQEGSDAP